jgi:hypothetical protein
MIMVGAMRPAEATGTKPRHGMQIAHCSHHDVVRESVSKAESLGHVAGPIVGQLSVASSLSSVSRAGWTALVASACGCPGAVV